MIGYASRTGTKRNLDALRAAGWRLLISATGAHRNEGFPYGIDNGAWTAFQSGAAFDDAAFSRLCLSHGDGADWIVVPDVVGDKDKSIEMTAKWFDALREKHRKVTLLVAVQDGMEEPDIGKWLDAGAGIFVGGTTEWKLSSMRSWGEVAHRRACYLHIARVNSKRRILLCHESGAHSFDGTSASKYAVSIGRLDAARRQGALFSVSRMGWS